MGAPHGSPTMLWSGSGFDFSAPAAQIQIWRREFLHKNHVRTLLISWVGISCARCARTWRRPHLLSATQWPPKVSTSLADVPRRELINTTTASALGSASVDTSQASKRAYGHLSRVPLTFPFSAFGANAMILLKFEKQHHQLSALSIKPTPTF